MSPAVEQNIIKRMKKQNELVMKPKMRSSTVGRMNQKKKEVTCGIATKSNSSRSTGKLIVSAKNNSTAKNQDVSPRQINKISPAASEGEPTGIRYIAYPIATTIPFNRTLSTSTPDPEKQTPSKLVNSEGVQSVSAQELTDQCNQMPPPVPPPPLKMTKAAKLQQIIQNQTKAAQRKTVTNSQFKPNKSNLLNQLKYKKESQVSCSNVPSCSTEQNAVSFSIHQVNKVAAAGQKLVSSQNSAFHQIVYNTSKAQLNSFNTDQAAYSQKMVANPCTQQTNKSFIPGNVQSISTNDYAKQSSNTNLFVKPPDMATDGLRSVPVSTSSQQPPLEDAAISLNFTPFPSRCTTPSCSEVNFELYSQEERLLSTEQCAPLPQYANAPATTNNIMSMTTVNKDRQAMGSLTNQFVQTEFKNNEFNTVHTQIASNPTFVPVDLSSRHDSQGLVPFEEPVRDSDTQTKNRSPREYPDKSDTLNKIPHFNAPVLAATKKIEPESISDDVGIKTNAPDHFNSQYSYVQHPNSNIHDLPPLQWQSVEALAGAKTLRFMINELEEICKSANQPEINRLIKQIQQVVNSLPQLSDTFDLQTEIGLSLQPLRNENSQLRRRLRIITEEASQEKEQIEAEQRRQTLELQLQLLNLEKRVDEEKLSKHQQLQQHEELVKELNLLKMERQSLVKDLGQRETSQFDMRRENWEENRKHLREVEILQKETEHKMLALEAAEKKNHILQITLEQRDMEISRMHEILVSAREGMKELIHSLCESKNTPPEGIEKFFNFITQDPTSEDNSSILKIVSAGDSADDATITDSWTASPVSSNKGSSTNVQKAALESSVDKRLQALLDTMKSSCQNQTLPKGIELLQTDSAVSNPATNSPKNKEFLSLGNQEMSCTNCPQSDIKDSGCGASPDTENLVSVSNDIHDQVSLNLNTFHVMNAPGGKLSSGTSPRESSADVTRASITDYFAKYPKAKPQEQSYVDDEEREEEEETEHLNAKQISNKIMQNILYKNQHFFTEAASELDVSSLSQYTVTTLSSLTGDVRTFRQGLASLDANIARLQASIKTSKNTFST